MQMNHNHIKFVNLDANLSAAINYEIAAKM